MQSIVWIWNAHLVHKRVLIPGSPPAVHAHLNSCLTRSPTLQSRPLVSLVAITASQRASVYTAREQGLAQLQ